MPEQPESERDGASLIAAERQRQMEAEGWTGEHDDGHRMGELAKAAVAYASEAHMCRTHSHRNIPPRGWPWRAHWWKPTGDPIRDLTKAGALIAAEIDRLQRLPAPVHREEGKG